MMLYILTYSTGCSTGFNKFVGIYDTIEKANEAMKRDMQRELCAFRNKNAYRITEYMLNRDMPMIYSEW